MRKNAKYIEIILFLILFSVYLIPTVNAIGLSPLSLDITTEKETETVRSIEVTNPSENPIHITGTVSSSLEEFITLEPEEFDLPAGPGIMNPGTRPSKYVTVKFNIPKEVSESTYTGEIVFTQQPVGGGTLGAAAQLGIPVKLTLGKIERRGRMVETEFPLYIHILIVVLIFTLILTLIPFIYRRSTEATLTRNSISGFSIKICTECERMSPLVCFPATSPF